MTDRYDIRPGAPQDALTCAQILNAWIDETSWMPRVHPADDVERHYREFVFAKRKIFVIGTPVQAYISLDMDEGYVTAFYAAEPGQGRGKALLEHAKTVLPEMRLWTFVANTLARAFYTREGFAEVDRSDGDNEEKLPDILYHWRAA